MNNDDVDTDGDLSDGNAATERDHIAPDSPDAEDAVPEYQDDLDEAEVERRRRLRTRVDVALKVHTGSLLPMTLLIEKGKVDAKSFVVDLGTGATALHYAAHHGNLKFLRWMHHKYPGDQELFNVRDRYGLNVAHYAARMGHLPCLMYAAEHMNVPLDIADNFGSTPLDLTLHYKMLYCFVYLYYSRGQRKMNLS